MKVAEHMNFQQSILLIKSRVETASILMSLNVITDVDECLVGNGGCHAKAQCTNTVGSRNCSCLPGYIGDGFGCAGK